MDDGQYSGLEHLAQKHLEDGADLQKPVVMVTQGLKSRIFLIQTKRSIVFMLCRIVAYMTVSVCFRRYLHS